MPRYDDLTADQRACLKILADAEERYGAEGFTLSRLPEPRLTVRHLNEPLPGVPADPMLYRALAKRGYLDMAPTDPADIVFTRRGYDALDYWGAGDRRCRWLDLADEMAHNDTLRSRLLWYGLYVVAALLVARSLRRNARG